jgi:hypothetical protein
MLMERGYISDAGAQHKSVYKVQIAHTPALTASGRLFLAANSHVSIQADASSAASASRPASVAAIPHASSQGTPAREWFMLNDTLCVNSTRQRPTWLAAGQMDTQQHANGTHAFAGAQSRTAMNAPHAAASMRSGGRDPVAQGEGNGDSARARDSVNESESGMREHGVAAAGDSAVQMMNDDASTSSVRKVVPGKQAQRFLAAIQQNLEKTERIRQARADMAAGTVAAATRNDAGSSASSLVHRNTSSNTNPRGHTTNSDGGVPPAMAPTSNSRNASAANLSLPSSHNQGSAPAGGRSASSSLSRGHVGGALNTEVTASMRDASSALTSSSLGAVVMRDVLHVNRSSNMPASLQNSRDSNADDGRQHDNRGEGTRSSIPHPALSHASQPQGSGQTQTQNTNSSPALNTNVVLPPPQVAHGFESAQAQSFPTNGQHARNALLVESALLRGEDRVAVAGRQALSADSGSESNQMGREAADAMLLAPEADMLLSGDFKENSRVFGGKAGKVGRAMACHVQCLGLFFVSDACVYACMRYVLRVTNAYMHIHACMHACTQTSECRVGSFLCLSKAHGRVMRA